MTEIEQVQALLGKQLSTQLRTELAERAAWQSRISVLYREAKSELARARGQMFNPTLTSEDKRRIDLDHKTREQQMAADILGDLQDILAQQLVLGESILASL